MYLYKLLESLTGLVTGLLTSLAYTLVLAGIFWFPWVHLGVGAKYFSFLPSVYQTIGYWDTFLVFVVLDVLKTVLLPSLHVRLGKTQDNNR